MTIFYLYVDCGVLEVINKVNFDVFDHASSSLIDTAVVNFSICDLLFFDDVSVASFN